MGVFVQSIRANVLEIKQDAQRYSACNSQVLKSVEFDMFYAYAISRLFICVRNLNPPYIKLNVNRLDVLFIYLTYCAGSTFHRLSFYQAVLATRGMATHCDQNYMLMQCMLCK